VSALFDERESDEAVARGLVIVLIILFGAMLWFGVMFGVW